VYGRPVADAGPAPLPPGNAFTRTLSDLNRLVLGCGPLLRDGGLAALLSLLALVPFGIVLAGAQLCCGLLLLLGGWSFVNAIVYVGPYAAFGHAALGRPLGTRAVLRFARSRVPITFLAFFAQFIAMIVLYLGWMAGFFGLLSWSTHSGDDLDPVIILIAATVVLVVFTLVAIAGCVRWLYLAPIIAVVEPPRGALATFRRSGELTKGRRGVLTAAMLAPYLIPIVTSPELNALSRLDNTAYALKNVISVVAPICGYLASIYATGLLTAAAYLVVTGRSPRTDDEDPVPA
jgi:hypothetical protein